MQTATDTSLDTESVSDDVLSHFEELDASRPPPVGELGPAEPQRQRGADEPESVRAARAAALAKGPDAAKPAGEQTAAAAPDDAQAKLAAQQEERRRQVQQEEAAREEALKAREARVRDWDGLVDDFKVDPADAIRRLAAAAIGSDDPKAIADYLANDVYTDLTVDLLEVKDPDKLDPNIKTRREIRKMERQLRTEKKEREKQARDAEEAQKKTQETAQIGEVKGTLSRWFEGQRSNYPFLATLAQNPTDEIFDMLLENEQMSPEEAARLANDYHRKESERYRKAFDLLPGGDTKKTAAGTATKAASAKTTASLTTSGATEGNVATSDEPPDDPDASAAYWAERLERDPEAMRETITRRRR